MGKYEIKAIYPSTEDGFVYADVLINDEEEPRKLILPIDTDEAQVVLSDYVTSEETPTVEETIPEVTVEEAPVVELIDVPIEV